MRRGIFKLAAYGTAPALLLGVAALYTYLVEFHAYDKGWKGANFDMFAEVDGPSTRVPRCYRLEPDGEVEATCPDALGPHLKQVRLVPNRARMRRAAAKLHTQFRDDGVEPLDGVRLEMWEFDYRPTPPELVFRKRHEQVWRARPDE